MPSTYTVNLGIEKPATGEQSGTWGDTTNVNFDILDQAINGAERVTLTSAGSSGSPNSLQITNGATSDGRNKWLEFYSSSDLGGSAYVQLDPNDAEKIVFVRNSLAGSQSVILFQGTYNAARDLEVPAGVDMVVKFDGGGASAATVTDVFTKLRATEITTPTLTAGTADINGGTVDGAVIGGSSAAAITGTTVTANTSLNIAGDGATVTGIKDEDDMSSNSPTKLATQQSIKAYVDSQVGTVDTWAEVLANGATSGSTNPEVTAGQALKTNTINETSAGSGVTIDSVLLKDDVVNATDIETSSISANDGTAAATIANSTGNFTITNFISNSVDIGGGAIDGTNIGASSAGTGTFTTLTSSGTTTIGGAAKFTGNVDTTSSTGIELKVGKISAVPSDVTDAFVAVHDTGGPGSLAGDIVLVPRSSNGIDNAVRMFSGYTTPVERLAVAYSELVVNDPSNNYDFRVESDNISNMLFVDAGNDTMLVANNITMSANEIDVASGNLTVDVAGDIILDADGADVIFADGGTQFGFIGNSSSDMVIKSQVQDKDLLFKGNDGGSTITALTLDMSDGGEAYFSKNIHATSAFLTTTNNEPQLTLISTDADASVGPRLDLYRNSSSPANGDVIGEIQFQGKDTVGSLNIFATISSQADQVNNGAEDGSLRFKTLHNGTLAERITIAQNNHVIINETGVDADFRVESDSNTHMLFVDGGANTVGINASIPRTTLHVNVDGATGGSTTDWNNDKWFLIADGSGASDSGFGITHTAASGTWINSLDPYTSWRDIIVNGDNFKYFQGGSRELMALGYTEAAFNDGSADQDFRVESNTQTHMLFVDGGNNFVGVAESSPDALLHVNATSSGNFQEALRLTNSGGGVNEGAFMRFEVSNTSGHGAIIGARRSGSGGIDLRFDTGEIDSAPVTAMTIDHDQNVGIGVGSGSISSLLHVGGNILSESSSTLNTTIRATGNNTRAIGNYQAHDSSGNDVNMVMGVFGDSNRGEVSTNTNHTLRFYVNNTPSKYLEIATTGQVFTSHGMVINEDSHDSDFRVESDSNTHMLFVDAGGAHVNIGTATDHGGVLNVETTGNNVNLALVCTDTDGNEGPILDLTRDAGNVPQDGDIMGRIRFRNDDTSLTMTNYVELTTVVSDVSNGTEDGQLQFNIIDAGTLRNFAHMTGGEGTVFNEDSHDIDFRVESDSNFAAFFVDAGNSRVGINQDVPTEALDIVGNVKVGSLLKVEDIIAKGSGGLTLQTDEGTKRIIVEDSGGVIVNETSADADFRVESDNNYRAIFVDAGSDRVEFGNQELIHNSVEVLREQFAVSANVNRRLRLTLSNYSMVRVYVAGLRTNSGNSVCYWEGYVNENDNVGYDHAINTRTGGGTISYTFTNNADGTFDWDFNNAGSGGTATVFAEVVNGTCDITVTTY